MDKTSFETFRDAVERKGLKTSNMRADGFMVECPTHEDRNPSVSVAYRNGKVLVNCHAGCDARDIVADLELVMEDLFDGEATHETKMLVARYPYRDGRTGEVAFYKDRFFPKTFLIGHFDGAGKPVSGFPEGVQPWLYHAPELKAGLDAGETIWVVEGEADVHAIEKMGGVATTQPHGAGPGKWREFHTHLLKRATSVRIVVDIDADKPDGSNTGRDYAIYVRKCLTEAGITATLWRSPVGKDASDALKAGRTLEDFQRYNVEKTRVNGTQGDELMAKVFPPLVYAVDHILPQGLAILAASPKSSKSFMSLDMALGVATGGICMSALQCTEGDVLYIGLEDSERRLKDRIGLLSAYSNPDLSRIEFQSIDSGWIGSAVGRGWIEEWAEGVESPRLVVIDTFRKAEPGLDEARNQYLEEQEVILHYKRLADRFNMTILLVHHNTKAADDGDWLNKFSGSKGITGGADTLLYIDFKRGERNGFLRIDGRDVVADDLPIYKPRGMPFWCAEQAPDSLPVSVGYETSTWEPSALQRAILALVGSSEGMDFKALGEAFPDEPINEDVAQLVRIGKLQRTGQDSTMFTIA